jgi:hypothetical protein
MNTTLSYKIAFQVGYAYGWFLRTIARNRGSFLVCLIVGVSATYLAPSSNIPQNEIHFRITR